MNAIIPAEPVHIDIPQSNRNRVVARRVTRYFLYGKGFARKIDAYRCKARSELNSKVWCEANRRDRPGLKLPWTTRLQIQRDLEKQVLAEMFPPKCDKPNKTNLPNLRHGGDHPFCRGCRWDYLQVRANEIMQKEEGR